MAESGCFSTARGCLCVGAGLMLTLDMAVSHAHGVAAGEGSKAVGHLVSMHMG